MDDKQQKVKNKFTSMSEAEKETDRIVAIAFEDVMKKARHRVWLNSLN